MLFKQFVHVFIRRFDDRFYVYNQGIAFMQFVVDLDSHFTPPSFLSVVKPRLSSSAGPAMPSLSHRLTVSNPGLLSECLSNRPLFLCGPSPLFLRIFHSRKQSFCRELNNLQHTLRKTL